MELKYQKQNPFNRNNLLALNNHNKDHLRHSDVNTRHHRIPTQYHSRVQHYPINYWNFRDQRHSGFTPYLPARNFQQFTSFQKQMLLNCGSSRKTSAYSSNLKHSRIESNPFYRKNLLISRQQIQDEIQKDLAIASYKYDGYQSQRRPSSHIISNYVDNYVSPHQQATINASIMMNLLNPLTQQNKVRSFGPRQSFNQSEHSHHTQQDASPHKSHSGYKQFITINGQKFYKTNVYPTKK